MSDLGNFSQCMVDSDAAARGRAKLLRGKALAASLLLEAVVIAGVLLWPLATLGVLPTQLVLTPVPPYHGDPSSRPTPPHQLPPASDRRNFTRHILQQPPVIPSHIDRSADAQPPTIDGGGNQMQPGETGLWVPGGGNTGPTVEIARPQTQKKPLKMSQGVMEGQLIHRVQPDYPRIATLIHLSGTVVLRATIGTDGEVHGLQVLSGNQILADAALAAVRQWRYRPTLLSGEAVEVETEVTVVFVLGSVHD